MGHFVYAQDADGNWFHGELYVNKDAVFKHWKFTRTIADTVSFNLQLAVDDGTLEEPDAFVTPQGGIFALAQRTAEAMDLHGYDMHSVYADKAGNSSFVLKRGYDKIVQGQRCVIMEDIIKFGTATMAVKAAIEAAGGIVVGVIALCNRGGKTAEDLGVPWLYNFSIVPIEVFPEDGCPLCQEHGKESVNLDLGHGRKFLERHGLPPPE